MNEEIQVTIEIHRTEINELKNKKPKVEQNA